MKTVNPPLAPEAVPPLLMIVGGTTGLVGAYSPVKPGLLSDFYPPAVRGRMFGIAAVQTRPHQRGTESFATDGRIAAEEHQVPVRVGMA